MDECAAQCGSISYDMMTTDDFNGEDILIDHDSDISEEVADCMMMEQLKQGIASLSDEEQELIRKLYFDRISERAYAKEIGLSHVSVNKKKQLILQKLKKYLGI